MITGAHRCSHATRLSTAASRLATGMPLPAASASAATAALRASSSVAPYINRWQHTDHARHAVCTVELLRWFVVTWSRYDETAAVPRLGAPRGLKTRRKNGGVRFKLCIQYEKVKHTQETSTIDSRLQMHGDAPAALASPARASTPIYVVARAVAVARVRDRPERCGRCSDLRGRDRGDRRGSRRFFTRARPWWSAS
jgi:hypothetical protein